MRHKISVEQFKLLLFSIFTSLVTYGFTLTNFSLSIDSETPVYSDFSLTLGRWGTNLVRYHIFEGHLPYFTLLLGLLLLSLTSVELSRLFKFNGTTGYLFCALFLTFPQLAYQLIFTMQADVVPLGFLFSTLAVSLFLESTNTFFSFKSISCFFISALLIMFIVALYQGLVLIPVIIYIIIFFQNTFEENFSFKLEIRKTLYFAGVMALGLVLYYVSVKIICPPVDGGYLSSYLTGNSDNQFSNSVSIWFENLTGKFYYGEKLFIIATGISLVLFVKFIIQKQLFVLRFLTLFTLLLVPFGFSFLITNGYHPPRIYVTSGIVFGFVIVHFISTLKWEKVTIWAVSLICITNIYFVTNLFYSNYKIFNHDKDTARKIDNLIQTKYPNFDPNINYVYFYGCLPYEHHGRYRLDKSEAFGGSLFSWDNGDNYRIINFFKFNDINYYKMIDNKETYLKIKDSIEPMPIWPNQESIKLINDVLVVKLGTTKGTALWVE